METDKSQQGRFKEAYRSQEGKWANGTLSALLI